MIGQNSAGWCCIRLSNAVTVMVDWELVGAEVGEKKTGEASLVQLMTPWLWWGTQAACRRRDTVWATGYSNIGSL